MRQAKLLNSMLRMLGVRVCEVNNWGLTLIMPCTVHTTAAHFVLTQHYRVQVYT